MLRSLKDIEDYSVAATDGIVGYVKDLYFDDESWVIRYLIVDTGAWLSQRRVLISPIAIDQPNWTTKTLPVSITREQIQRRRHLGYPLPHCQYKQLVAGSPSHHSAEVDR
jgi:hypothetical protein